MVLLDFARYLNSLNQTLASEIYSRYCLLKPSAKQICKFADNITRLEISSSSEIEKLLVKIQSYANYLSKNTINPVSLTQWISKYTLIIKNGQTYELSDQVQLTKIGKLNQLRQISRSVEERGFIGLPKSQKITKKMIVDLYTSLYEPRIEISKFDKESWHLDLNTEIDKQKIFRTRCTSVPGYPKFYDGGLMKFWTDLNPASASENFDRFSEWLEQELLQEE